MMAMNYESELKDLIQTTRRERASDLHISAGRHPTLRVSGKLTPLVQKPVLVPENTSGLVFAMLSEDMRKKFLEERELDFSYNFEGKARFRVNAYFERGFMAAALRLVPVEIKTVADLNLPEILL